MVEAKCVCRLRRGSSFSDKEPASLLFVLLWPSLDDLGAQPPLSARWVDNEDEMRYKYVLIYLFITPQLQKTTVAITTALDTGTQME